MVPFRTAAPAVHRGNQSHEKGGDAVRGPYTFKFMMISWAANGSYAHAKVCSEVMERLIVAFFAHFCCILSLEYHIRRAKNFISNVQQIPCWNLHNWPSSWWRMVVVPFLKLNLCIVHNSWRIPDQDILPYVTQLKLASEWNHGCWSLAQRKTSVRHERGKSSQDRLAVSPRHMIVLN